MELLKHGQHATLELDPAGVARLTMCHEESRNALGEAMVRALEAALEAAEAWPALKVVVLLGLPDMFSSGADPSLLARLVDGSLSPTEILLPRRIFAAPVPVIAAMEGHAIGGGLALGVSADVVVAARESRYGVTFTDLGFTPGMGTTRLLEHVMTPALAHELLYTGELRRGTALEGRAFNAVLPRREVRAHALAVAARIAEKPRPTLELLHQTLTLPRRQGFEASLTTESMMHRLSFREPEVRARLRELT